MVGIYSIKNTINGKLYIGKSRNVNIRIEVHKKKLRKNKHVNKHLQHSWNKYGEENFDIDIIEKFSIEELNLNECYYIKNFGAINENKGYNLTYGGDGGIFSPETIKKMSEAQKGEKSFWYGKKHNQATIEKIRKAHLGKKMSKEARENLSKARKGIKISEKTKKIISKSCRKSMNTKRKDKLSKVNSGEGNGRAKLTWEKVGLLRKFYKTKKFKIAQLCIMFKIGDSQLYNIVNNKCWVT